MKGFSEVKVYMLKLLTRIYQLFGPKVNILSVYQQQNAIE